MKRLPSFSIMLVIAVFGFPAHAMSDSVGESISSSMNDHSGDMGKAWFLSIGVSEPQVADTSFSTSPPTNLLIAADMDFGRTSAWMLNFEYSHSIVKGELSGFFENHAMKVDSLGTFATWRTSKDFGPVWRIGYGSSNVKLDGDAAYFTAAGRKNSFAISMGMVLSGNVDFMVTRWNEDMFSSSIRYRF